MYSSNSNRNSRFPFSVITGKTIARILNDDLQGCIDTVRNAYLAHHHGQSRNPPSVFLRFSDKPNARIIALPAHLDDQWNISGIKWIASFPDNIREGTPRASAILILNNHDNGYPFACLESSIISAARTAASAVLAAEHILAGKRFIRSLGIIGSGFIARYVYRFLMETNWQINDVRLFDISTVEAERFAASVCYPSRHSSVSIASSVDSVITESDLILLATVASKPHIHELALFQHLPVVLHISLRDLAPEILMNACNIVDDVDHVMQADTSPHLTEKLTGGRDFVTGTLAELLEGTCSPDRTQPVVFSPFGLGLLDLAVGKWIYDQAIASGENIPVSEFFYELQR